MGKRKTLKTGAVFIAILAGFIVFLTSKSWLVVTSDLAEATKIGGTVYDGSLEATLYRWQYSPSQGLMEIELSVENTHSSNADVTYRFGAVSNHQGSLDIATVADGMGVVVLQLPRVPKGWTEIAVLAADSDDQMCQIVTNREQVETVNEIATRSQEDYMKGHFNEIASGYEEEIKRLEDENRRLEEDIAGYKENIKAIEREQSYETAEERQKSNEAIMDYQVAITEAENRIESNGKQVSEYRERIGLARKRSGSD